MKTLWRGNGLVRVTSCLPPLVLLVAALVLSALPAFCVSIQPGWPQAAGGYTQSSPALGDLDGDGKLEVVVGSGIEGNVYAWHSNGTPVTGWPQATGDQMLEASPALGDLDGDGDLEVVISSTDGKVYAWHGDGSPLAGWPQSGGNAYSSAALGDLDGDGDLEVVYDTCGGSVCAWHGDGSPVTGWPQVTGRCPIGGSPALGDLDGDGGLEVVVGSGDRLYAWHGDGSPVAGWPPEYDVSASSPALGDMDGDGKLEVVVACTFRDSSPGKVYAFHGDGSLVAGWPQTSVEHNESSPALGDLDGDGKLEVVEGTDDGYTGAFVYAWHHDGTPVAGWPRPGGGYSSPALGDVDGDGKLEVVIGSSDYNVYAWHGDGSPVAGWPQAAESSIQYSSVALGDLDGDGDVEVVVGADVVEAPDVGGVYVWSCDTPTEDLLPWPMFHHDAMRTGLYAGAVVSPGARFIASPLIGAAPLQVSFTDQSTDNPSSWYWSFGDEATSAQQNPVHTYTAPGHHTVSLSVVTDSGPFTQTKPRCVTALFPDVLTDQWAWRQVIACVDSNIVKGYTDGLYRPEHTITRDQMAVYTARALASPTGDAGIPDGPATPSFSDVPADYWAYKQIEYAVSQNVVEGYEDGTYQPASVVDRGQMAVYVARSLVAPTGEAALADYVPSDPRNFPDVLAGFWAWKHIEYCVEHGVVSGYEDGLYHPEVVVTRDQMAVYIARAFRLL